MPMYSACNDLKGRVSPFGNLRIKVCLLTPRSLSQATTSFIACNRQGIHHVHLFTCPYNVSPLRLNKGAVIEIRSTTLLRLLIHTIITHHCDFYIAVINKNLLTSSRLLKNITALDLEKIKSKRLRLHLNSWWRMTGSNRRPPACKAGALPAELIPHGCETW
jgi:hypothetical protein